MRRGDLYRVRRPTDDPRQSRVYVIVSPQPLIDSRYSTVICAPVFTRRAGLVTEVNVGAEHGLKHDSAIHCDNLVSIPKSKLTDHLSSLPRDVVGALDRALGAALALGASPSSASTGA